MPIRNAHWYNQNDGRAYPVDDSASAQADDGVRLPPDIVTDLSLRWPSPLGAYAFLTAVANTAGLVTLTIQGCDDPRAESGFTPLAVVSVRKPVQAGRVYPLAGQAPGVAGWVVFGGGTAGKAYRGRFSTPAQSLLCRRAARPYRPLPVSSVQADNAEAALTGVVTLKANPPLEVVKEERPLAGALRDCIVVRLVDGAGADGFPVPPDAALVSGYKAQSLFRQFAGPCAGRPESNTCGCPEPIEFVNAVPPDCDGVLTLEFRGCAQVAQVAGGGIAVGCQLGLVDACVPPQIPSSEGLLPSEYDPANVPVPPDIPPPPGGGGVSDSLVVPADLPYLVCFPVGVPNTLVEAGGTWEVSADASPTAVCLFEDARYPVSESVSVSASHSESVSLSSSYSYAHGGSLLAAAAATRNVAYFGGDASAVYRRATTEVKLSQGPVGAKRNAQLVINFRDHPSVPGEKVYFAAEVNYDTQTFRLLRFNGTTFQEVVPATVTPGIQLEKWYRVTATTLPGGGAGGVTITIRLESLTDPGVTDVTLAATVSNYQPSTGKFGVGTNRAVAAFGYLKIEEASA